MVYFISDEHYGHANIIKYCSRPFSSIDEMNWALVNNFNSVVNPDDLTYHLGDFSLHEKYVKKLLPSLNGKHILIAGNHDIVHSCHKKKAIAAKQRYLEYGFLEIHERLIIDVPELGGEVLLTHMPKSGTTSDVRYEQYRPNDWLDSKLLLHGHIHNNGLYDAKKNQLNVGVDVWNFHPASLDAVINFIKNNRR